LRFSSPTPCTSSGVSGLGLITNHTGIDSRRVSSIDRLAEEAAVALVSLFSPEHGIRGDAEGGVAIESDEMGGPGFPSTPSTAKLASPPPP
jgi:uncharacterized protein YbbC (DUF1343 family)